MIEIPIRDGDSIKIGGFDYTIHVNYEVNLRLLGDYDRGQCDHIRQQIRLRTDLTSQQQSEVFLHEASHGMNKVYLNGSLGENDIAGMANGIFQLLEQFGIRFVIKEETVDVSPT